MSNDFVEFPKIPRWSRDIVITEKIDGTNAQIWINENKEPFTLQSGRVVPFLCGSRSRWIFPENDNYGFARWAYSNEALILRLGDGHHFGEWWGRGIQRGYDMKEKRFSLFNVGRWTPEKIAELNADQETPFFYAVPTLYTGPLMLEEGVEAICAVDDQINFLRQCGSMAAPGFMRPEGVVVYHTASGHLYKKTIEKDEQHKGQA